MRTYIYLFNFVIAFFSLVVISLLVYGLVTPQVVEAPLEEKCTPVGELVSFSFLPEFVSKYQYEESKGYGFALGISIDGKNVGYYNTFRNRVGGVSNDKKLGLNGVIPAYDIFYNKNNSVFLPYGETIKVSNTEGTFGFKRIVFTGGNIQYRRSPTKETDKVMRTSVTIVKDCIQHN